MTFRSLPLSWVRAGLMAATLSLSIPAAQAAGPSDLSAVPVAVSVTAPSGFFAGSAMLVNYGGCSSTGHATGGAGAGTGAPSMAISASLWAGDPLALAIL